MTNTTTTSKAEIISTSLPSHSPSVRYCTQTWR